MLAPWEAGLFGHFTKREPEDLGTEGPKSCGRCGAGGARATVKISKRFSCSWKKRVQAKQGAFVPGGVPDCASGCSRTFFMALFHTDTSVIGSG